MVLDVLLLALKQQHIDVICSCKVSSVSYIKNRFVIATGAYQNYYADKVIISTGGKAAPNFGSDGSGYLIAKSFGHKCLNLYPCLVPFCCKYDGLNGLKGIHVHGVAKLYSNGTLLGTSKGEILLTDYGISGIPAMDLSCCMNQVKPNAKCEIQIDLFPDWESNQLRTFLDGRVEKYADETLEMFFTGLINKKIAYSVLKCIGIAPLSRLIGSLKPQELDVLTKTLKSWKFPVTSTLLWDKAQTTGGGIPLDEINPTTMESRLQSGLFLTGELLDAVGECGGFNLHWAWCTGIFAGKSAAGLV
jgi:predicted Rossmann fold flavoprotein